LGTLVVSLNLHLLFDYGIRYSNELVFVLSLSESVVAGRKDPPAAAHQIADAH